MSTARQVVAPDIERILRLHRRIVPRWFVVWVVGFVMVFVVAVEIAIALWWLRS